MGLSVLSRLSSIFPGDETNDLYSSLNVEAPTKRQLKFIVSKFSGSSVQSVGLGSAAEILGNTASYVITLTMNDNFYHCIACTSTIY